MKNPFCLILLAVVLSLAPTLNATNGDNLIAIGPVARGMGGVTIANPQDAISAVFGNPAAMCYGPFCPSSQVDFGGTAFMPSVDASVINPYGMGTRIDAKSDEKVYPIPAIGLSIPFGGEQREKWRFGLAAYGVTGLGVDYRGTAIDNPNGFGPGAPLVSGTFTSLQIMKFAPAIAYQVAPNFSLGAAFHIDYATLDLGTGSSPGFGYGLQVGGIWRPIPNLSLGASYTTPQNVTHGNVVAQPNMAGGISYFDLDLEAPQQLGGGISYEALDNRLILGAEIKWINWGDAKGYSDFDWKDQEVYALGVQYEAIRGKLFLRAGYNFGSSPVTKHNGWNGSFTPQGPAEIVNVQGIPFPRYYYETFRVIGFPAIVTHHYTLGFSYEFTETFVLSAAYMRAPEQEISQQGLGPAGAGTTIQSRLSEDSLEFGFSWRF
jgi:long-chain fatty acid transport protein